MIWSAKGWNPVTGELGVWVFTLGEAEGFLVERRRNGDLRPELLRESQERFFREIDEVKRREGVVCVRN